MLHGQGWHPRAGEDAADHREIWLPHGYPAQCTEGLPAPDQAPGPREYLGGVSGGISWETAFQIPAAAIGLVGSATSWEEGVGVTFLKSAKYLEPVRLRKSDLGYPWKFLLLTPFPIDPHHLVQPLRLDETYLLSDLISRRGPSDRSLGQDCSHERPCAGH